MGHAATIVRVGASLQVSSRGWVIALATAMQESDLRNLGHLGDRNDHDSLGLFQQRPSQGWGTPEQIMDPEYAATRFYRKLLTVAGWQLMPLTQAAQAVQVSAFPAAYAKHEPAATALANFLDPGGSWLFPGSLEQCVSVAGWTHPLPGYQVTSGFRTADRPSHDGVDIPAPKGTPIRAAASGVVIKVRCNASYQGQPYSCDVDGSPETPGCGWYSEILTINHVHRYCHQLRKPTVVVGQSVSAGQVIGVVGSSGHSSGPHLHFEVHVGKEAGQPIDPVSFMRAMSVPGF